MSSPRIYVASPLGFTAAGRLWCAEVLLPALEAAGCTPLEPFSHNPQTQLLLDALAEPDLALRRTRLVAANRAVAEANIDLIHAADALLAVLDGPDVDSGTAAEIGYAAARNLPCVGLRTDLRVSGDNEATLVNLQVETFILRTGGGLHRDLTDALADVCRLCALPARAATPPAGTLPS